MRIDQILAKNKYSISFEFFPPKEKAGEERLFENIGRLKELKPSFVSLTYGAGGGTSRNTLEVIKRIKRETALTAMFHLTCINQNSDELKAIMEEYRRNGIENMLALRGDPPVVNGQPVPSNVGRCHATDLIQLAAPMKAFSIGVAGYPEGQIESRYRRGFHHHPDVF